MGSKPGTGKRTLEMSLRLHVFSSYTGFVEAQTVMAVCIQLLADAPSVTGYGSWYIRHDETIPLSGQMVAGQVVNELVGNFTLFVSET
jgi:hypothetical protein